MTQRYLVLSKHAIHGVRTGHYVYLTDEEGRRKTETGHVEPAPPPKRKPPRPRRAAKPPAPPEIPEPRSDAGLSHVTESAAAAEESEE